MIIALAVGVLASCGDDGGSKQRLDAGAIEAALESRLEQPGINTLKVASIMCPSDQASSVGASFECAVEADRVDGSGSRIGVLRLTQKEASGRSFAVEGTLSGPGGSNEYRITLITAPPGKGG